jgi:hypothetical protein
MLFFLYQFRETMYIPTDIHQLILAAPTRHLGANKEYASKNDYFISKKPYPS